MRLRRVVLVLNSPPFQVNKLLRWTEAMALTAAFPFLQNIPQKFRIAELQLTVGLCCCLRTFVVRSICLKAIIDDGDFDLCRFAKSTRVSCDACTRGYSYYYLIINLDINLDWISQATAYERF